MPEGIEHALMGKNPVGAGKLVEKLEIWHGRFLVGGRPLGAGSGSTLILNEAIRASVHSPRAVNVERRLVAACLVARHA
jgi:hypothetical protein